MWIPAALVSEVSPYDGLVWRVVETQYTAATMRLTGSLEEQRILENVLEGSKPPLPPECRELDFLLSTPFRYAPPWPHGSRFRRAHQPEGVFYAAENVEASIAESAFYSLLFYFESPGTMLPTAPVEHTAFNVPCATDKHIDLTVPRLNEDQSVWIHPVNYAPCQKLADVARQIGVDIIRYASVRDPEHRPNIAIMTCRAFASAKAQGLETWHLYVQRNGVRAWSENPRMQLEFSLDTFSADPRIEQFSA